MIPPLIDRLTAECGFPRLDEAAHDTFVKRHQRVVLFFAGDPARYPESHDVAVVLPELVKTSGDRISVAVIEPSAEAVLQRRYGFNAWPALVYLFQGEYLGCITRIHEWSVYQSVLAQLLNASPACVPGIGIPPVSVPMRCHGTEEA